MYSAVAEMTGNVTAKEMRDKRVRDIYIQGEYKLAPTHIKEEQGGWEEEGRAQRAGRLNDPCHHPHTDNTCLCPPPFHLQLSISV